jgi:hypothetical protein
MQRKSSMKNKSFFVLAFLLIILGLAIRLFDLDDAPLDFHPTRQLHSALMARGMYYQLTGDASEKAAVAIRQWKLEGLIEPPIMEWLAAFGYKLAGGVDLRIPRLIAILFWLLAVIPLLVVAKRGAGWKAALVGAGFFLFIPYGIIASRSFQPEALLVLLLALFFMALSLWDNDRSWKWAVWAGVLGGLSVLIKTVAAFFVAGMWLGWLLSDENWKTAIKEKKMWVAFLLTVLPYAAYLAYGLWIDKSYAGQFSLRFFPSMWTELSFYLRWLSNLRRVVDVGWLVLGIIGTLLLEKKSLRNILVGAWMGYILLGFVLPYHISTHDYYHLPLLFLVALGLCGLFAGIFSLLEKRSAVLKGMGGVCLLLLFGVYAMDARSELKKVNYSAEVSFWERVATLFSPADRVIALSQDYGNRLAYWGWLTPRNWPSLDDIELRRETGQDLTLEDYFADYTDGYDYFLITDFDEFARQPQLEEWLHDKYPLLFTDEGVLLFDLTPGSP